MQLQQRREKQVTGLSQRFPSVIPQGGPEPPRFDPQKEADRILSKYAPASVLVDSGMAILQIRGSTGAYLEAPTGKATHDVLKMAREDLMLPLRAAVPGEEGRSAYPDGGRAAQTYGQFREIRLEGVNRLAAQKEAEK